MNPPCLNRLFCLIPRGKFIHSNGISRTKVCIDALNKCPNGIDIKLNEKRLLKVAIIGAPNAGKSTLINQIVNRRVFGVSKKVHTTKRKARAIYNENNVQLVFLDTPGLVTETEKQKYKLPAEFVSGGKDAVVEADVIGVVHDLSNHFTRNSLDSKVLQLLHLHKNKESILILNKTDTIKSKKNLLQITNTLTAGKLKHCNQISQTSLTEKEEDMKDDKTYWENFSEVFMVSALLGSGITELKMHLLKAAYTGDWLFPDDVFTDQKPVELITEVVRSKLLEHLPQEVPYNLKVDLEYLDVDLQDNCMTAVVLIGCSRPNIESVVKGKRGARIRRIAVEAEQALCDAFFRNFYLKLIISSS